MEEQLRNLAAMMDHTLLKADATKESLLQVCRECEQWHFRMIAVNSAQVSLCAEALRNTEVHVGAAISFPLGQTERTIKLMECEQAIHHGADEIDYVINLTEVKAGNWAAVQREMEEMTRLCHRYDKICKVILETCYLTEEEIVILARMASRVRPDFIKTSTGFGSAGATVQHVRLMKAEAGDHVQVKAAGGIRSLDTLLAMREAGATRIGTSASVQIMEEASRRLKAGERW